MRFRRLSSWGLSSRCMGRLRGLVYTMPGYMWIPGRGMECALSETHAAADVIVKDPVCGMTVDPARTAHHATHDGRAVHFCCAGCRTRFETDPDHYLNTPAPPPPAPAAAGPVYTCPGDPGVRQGG